MPVNRDREHVGPGPEDVLCAVAVVEVDVQNGHPPVLRDALGRHGGVVEVAEPPEHPPSGVVPRRAADRVGHRTARQDLLGGAQGHVHRRPGGPVGVAVQGGEGVDAVVARPHRQLLRFPVRTPHGEHVGVDRPARRQAFTDRLEVVDEIRIVNLPQQLAPMGPGFDRGEVSRGEQHFPQRLDPGGPFDVAALADVVDAVRGRGHQGHRPEQPSVLDFPVDLGLEVAGLPQANRVVGDRTDHLVDVLGPHQIAVFAFQDQAHGSPALGAGKRPAPAQAVEEQERRRAVADRRLVGRVGDGIHPVVLVELEPPAVLLENSRVLHGSRIVGEGFQIDTAGTELPHGFPGGFIQGAAEASALDGRVGGDEIQQRAVNFREVQDQREPADLVIRA